jgi:hypothetical protein
MTVETSTYKLEGDLLEACSCNTLCPCWIGEDPDTGYCDGTIGWHIDRGEIRGVDVSGLTVVGIAKIPGNVFAGNWKAVIIVDDRATPEQQEALLEVFSGKLGGAIADLAALIGEILEVKRAPIRYAIEKGHGTIEVEGILYSDMEAFKGPDGETTKLVDSIFSTIPGSPAYVAKANSYKVNLPDHDMTWEYSGRNAVQGHFLLQA